MISPILANIYLDRLDAFVEQVLIPAHTRGETRRRNNQHRTLKTRAQYWEQKGDYRQAHALRKEMRSLPSGDPHDPGFRRLSYLRYTDDFLLGFIGPRVEAEAIKQQLGAFLRETLKLELSHEKTLITQASAEAAHFLGYEIVGQHANDQLDRHGRRRVNGIIGLRVPAGLIRQRIALFLRNGKPTHRSELIHDSDYTIMRRYQAEFRGLVQYYVLATNVSQFGKLQWVMQQSLCRTLAAKHASSARKIARKYQTKVQTEHGPRSCLQVVIERGAGKAPLVAQFGGIPLRRQRKAVLVDRVPTLRRTESTELLQRLLAERCELCGSTQNVEVHHIRKLKDLYVKGRRPRSTWGKMMAERRRKTLVVCDGCHHRIHAGKHDGRKISEDRPPESRVR